MMASFEKDGYTAELTVDGLEVVYRNPRGRKLKTVPAQLAGDPGLVSLLDVRKALRAHRMTCEEYAGAWAEAAGLGRRASIRCRGGRRAAAGGVGLRRRGAAPG